MNLDELKSERAKIAQEIEEKTREMQADLAAFDRLIAKYGGASEDPIDGEKPAQAPRPRFVASRIRPPLMKVNLAELVRKAIADFKGDSFSKNTIISWLVAHHPLVEPNHATISAQLWHMDKKGMLETVQERNGNKPALYKATERFSLAA